MKSSITPDDRRWALAILRITAASWWPAQACPPALHAWRGAHTAQRSPAWPPRHPILFSNLRSH
jgi:hypothetical protein